MLSTHFRNTAKSVLLLIGATCLCSSCETSERFNKDQWNTGSDAGMPPECRRNMVKDLVENHKLKGLRYNELIQLVGPPKYADSNMLSYDIITDYGSDIDPVHTKSLVFHFKSDSFISSFEVEEWKK